MDRQKTRTTTIAGPHIVAGQLINDTRGKNAERNTTSLRGLGGVDNDPMLTSVLSSNVAGIVMLSSTGTTGASSLGFLGGRPGLRPDLGCNVNNANTFKANYCTHIGQLISSFASNVLHPLDI